MKYLQAALAVVLVGAGAALIQPVMAQAPGRNDPSAHQIFQAVSSGRLTDYRISEPKIMGYLRNNSIFAFGRADRAKQSATYREILDAMWLFNRKFERTLAEFNRIMARH